MAITFDTYKFVETLTASGIPEAQAKAEMEALNNALNETINDYYPELSFSESLINDSFAVRDLATKLDLETVKVELIKWMAGLLLAQGALVVTLVKLLS
jgi:hypothetical protein